MLSGPCESAGTSDVSFELMLTFPFPSVFFFFKKKKSGLSVHPSRGIRCWPVHVTLFVTDDHCTQFLIVGPQTLSQKPQHRCRLDDQRDRSLRREDLVCVIAQLARSVLDSLCQDLPRCFLESGPLLHNRREQTNLATLLTQHIGHTWRELHK